MKAENRKIGYPQNNDVIRIIPGDSYICHNLILENLRDVKIRLAS